MVKDRSMIAIIDYGLGNIFAFANILKQLGTDFIIADNKSKLDGAKKIILPGVGAFDQAMSLLNKSGMRQKIDELVLSYEIPIVGICVGMQIMANSSEEGSSDGLGYINAKVKKIRPNNPKYIIPHMGWNTIEFKDNKLFTNLGDGAKFYFLHSYFVECKYHSDSIAETEYFGKFTSAINHKNFYGLQFHPEKSHTNGINILKNFTEL